MRAIGLEQTRLQRWAARSAGAAVRAFDLQLTIYAALLTLIGLAMAYSNSAAAGPPLAAGSTFVRGVIWAVIALAAYLATAAFDYKWLRTFAWPIYLVNLGLLAGTLAIGSGVGGSARWVSVLGFQFQFSELAKVLMIVVLANFLASREGRLGSPVTILGACLLVVPAWLLVMLQPDLGTSLVFAAVLAGMLFMSGASLRWLGLLTAGVVAAVPLAWTYVLRDYQKQRLVSLINPGSDPQGSGYQVLQSQIAVASGGCCGKGLTSGTQGALGFLPVQGTDFVFAVLAEELGFIGALVVLGLFVALIWRLLVAAWRSRDSFGLLVASGIASMLVFQLFVNIGMVVGIMPITGIPLPFVTYGGASLVSLAAGLGVVQSVNVRRRKPEW